MRILRHVAVVALLLTTAQALLHAGTTGKIAGVARDARTREPLPGVNVVVLGTSLGASTDVEGRYTILNVPPGRYTVSASFIGYRRFEIRDLGVSVDFTTPLDINLEEGTVELEAVVVQAERTPLIRQDLTNPVASITEESFEVLPVLEISEVIGLQAGVVVDDDGSIHIRGGLGNEIAYTLNGVNINNPYGNQRSVGIATNAVKEVSVSSGTFAAEYGTALSGVVNYITRDGGSKWTGNVRYLLGDYATSHDDLFFNINDFSLGSVNRAEASIGGPLISEDVTVFASGVYNWNRGHLYGERLYIPEDAYLSREQFPEGDPRRGTSTDPLYFGPVRHDTTDLIGLPGGTEAQAASGGDLEPVSLNWTRGINLLGNIGVRILPEMRIKYEILYDQSERPDDINTLAYRYRPDSPPLEKSEGIVHSVDFTHSVSPSVFYSVKGSFASDYVTSWVYDDPLDPRYIPDFYFDATLPNTAFLTGGVDPDRFARKTKTWGLKADVVAQVLSDHEIKAGFEGRWHTVDVESYTLLFADPANPNATPNFSNMLVNGNVFLPYIPTAEGGRQQYSRTPNQIALYLQDKIELFESIILNVGLRYDRFDPQADYNTDISGELESQDSIFLYKNLAPATVKHMWQPRVSVSYPITDQGTIRFSYGHFYQVGSLSSLYRNPNYRAPLGTSPSFGNPEVEPQRSIQYELGVQQGLAEDLRLEITGYYKDVTDYIYSQRVVTARGDKQYYLMTNLAYANTRGISISLLKRRAPAGLFSATLDYTFQVSEGNRTEPFDEVFFSEQTGRLSETYLVPQSFDRSHTLTGTLNLGRPDDWSVGIIGFLRTGTPYTPEFPPSVVPITFTQNSDRQLMQWNVDLKLEKFFETGPVMLSLFVQVDNLFDVQNEIAVYNNSGRALYNIETTTNPAQFSDITRRITLGHPGLPPQEAITDYYENPANIGRPRLVRLGATVTF